MEVKKSTKQMIKKIKIKKKLFELLNFKISHLCCQNLHLRGSRFRIQESNQIHDAAFKKIPNDMCCHKFYKKGFTKFKKKSQNSS